MSHMLRLAAVAGLALAVSIGSATAGSGRAAGRPARGRSLLAPPEGGVDANAKGRVWFKHFPARGDRLERSWVRFHLKHLDAGTTYTIWADDPSTPDDHTLVQVGDPLLAQDDGDDDDQGEDNQGNINDKLDTDQGEDMPFLAALEDLQGGSVEIHDENGAVVLAGVFPTLE